MRRKVFLAGLSCAALAAAAALAANAGPPGAAIAELHGALAQFDHDAGAPRSSVHGHSVLRSKGAIVVAGRGGPPRRRAYPAAAGIVVIDSTPDTLAALRRLGAEVEKFERAAGPDSAHVTACRRREGKCLKDCRAAMRRLRLRGKCSCIGVRAQCLDKAYRPASSPGETPSGGGVRGRQPKK